MLFQVAMSFLLLADYRRGRGRNSLVSMVVALSLCIELSVFVVGVRTTLNFLSHDMVFMENTAHGRDYDIKGGWRSAQ